MLGEGIGLSSEGLVLGSGPSSWKGRSPVAQVRAVWHFPYRDKRRETWAILSPYLTTVLQSSRRFSQVCEQSLAQTQLPPLAVRGFYSRRFCFAAS